MVSYREDAVSPGRPFELFFKSGDMNDVLKSLTMVDVSDKAGGGARLHLLLLCARQISNAERWMRVRVHGGGVTNRSGVVDQLRVDAAV
jgi:hypothetical protein